MAGYPSNTIQDLSIKFFEFSALILSMLPWLRSRGLRSWPSSPSLAFPGLCILPPAIFFLIETISKAARHLWHSWERPTGGTPYQEKCFSTAWWVMRPAAYTSVLGVTLLYRIAKNPSLWSASHFRWLILMLAIPPLHLQSVVIFMPPTIALLFQRDIFRRNLLIWALVGGTLSILVNLPWLAPAFVHRADGVYSELVDQLPLFISVDPFTFLKDYVGPAGYWTFRSSFSEKGFRLMLLLLGSWGTWKLVRSENRAAGVLLAATWFFLFLFVYFGSLIPFLKSWQPLRFKVSL